MFLTLSDTARKSDLEMSRMLKRVRKHFQNSRIWANILSISLKLLEILAYGFRD